MILCDFMPRSDVPVAIVRDYPDGRGRRISRQADGSVKVEFVRIIDDPEHPLVKAMPSLWPDYLKKFFDNHRPRTT